MTKICTKCGIEKDESDFYRRKGYKNGIKSNCKICQALASVDYQKSNKEKLKLKKKLYDEKNKQKISIQGKEYYQKNINAKKNKIREYYLQNFDRIKIRTKKYKEENREHYLQLLCKKNKRKVDSLKPVYLKAQLQAQMKKMGLLNNKINFDPEMVELYKLTLKIKRHVKAKKQARSQP